jgi:hypothetical protein
MGETLKTGTGWLAGWLLAGSKIKIKKPLEEFHFRGANNTIYPETQCRRRRRRRKGRGGGAVVYKPRSTSFCTPPFTIGGGGNKLNK